MAAAWVDDADPETLYLARGLARPLWIARGRHEVLFASTRDALELVERTVRTTFSKTEVAEGRLLSVQAGRVVEQRRFTPDRSYREQGSLPAVRAPLEGRSCLERLAAIAAA
jgi:asparagine synthetase B (glutamine-hydrolysing)